MLQTLFPQSPMSTDIANFAQAAPDSFNPGAAALTSHGASALYPVFVDDTGNVNTRKKISDTVTASVLAAYLLFGFPGGDTWGHRPPCINAQKWPTHLRHQVTFLGFEIDTRAMTLTWPVEKRRRLQHRINVIKENARAGGQVPCKLLAQTLGLLRNGCLVLPLGSTLSLQTQYAVNDKVKAAFQGGISPRKQRIFWDTARVRLTPGVLHDLDDLSILLEVDTPHSRAWCRPIGLLVPRPIQFTFLSDASYDGLGGGGHHSLASCGGSQRPNSAHWASRWSSGRNPPRTTHPTPFTSTS